MLLECLIMRMIMISGQGLIVLSVLDNLHKDIQNMHSNTPSSFPVDLHTDI